MAQQQTATMDSTGTQDAISLLRSDHRKVKTLFEEYEKKKESASAEEKFEIAKKVCGELLIHMAIEEGIFYPAARRGMDDEEIMNEAQVEHDGAKDLIIQLGELQPNDPMFDAKITVLSEQIDHHVEEEEKSMFPKVRASNIDIDALGRELLEARTDMRRRLGLPEE